MLLGLITDIHEDVPRLRAAVDHLRRERVDQIVMIGDVCSMTERLAETCAILAAEGITGVWGNHDFGLCHQPSKEFQEKYAGVILDYMSTLRPHLVIEGCLFSHVEPWLDAWNPADLWYFKGPPDTPDKLARSFTAVPHRTIFIGHMHRWLHATPQGLSDWNGTEAVQLSSPERHFVVVGALCDGCYATYETENGLLTPYRLADGA